MRRFFQQAIKLVQKEGDQLGAEPQVAVAEIGGGDLAQEGDQNGVVADTQNANDFVGEVEKVRFDGGEEFGVEVVDEVVEEGAEGGVAVGDGGVQVFDVGFGEVGFR